MLQILRDKAQSTFIQAIVVVIALVFIFWGVGANMMNSREAAIMVNGEEISFQDFQTAYDRAYQNIAAQFGGNLPKGLADSLGIKQQVIKQLIQAALLRQGAAEMGIVVSAEEVQNSIKNMVQFQEVSGFSMDKYKSLLAANRLTPHKFETNMRFDMLAEKTVRDIGSFAALANPYEVETLYNQSNEKVEVSFSKISPSDFSSSITVDEAELAKWFDTAKENYRSEPQMDLKYLDFSFATIGSQIEMDDTRAQSYYDDNVNEFTDPEKRRARHILIKTNESDSAEVLKEKAAKAAELLVLVNASDDFAELAEQYSEGPSKSNGGNLGFFSRGQMVAPFENAVFSMSTGEVSEVVKTRFGYHIIKLEDIQPAVVKPFKEVKDSIVTKLQRKEAEPLAFQLANSAYEGIIGAGSLKAYNEGNPEQKIIETGYFEKSVPPQGLSLDNQFLDTAFTLKQGELSSLLKTANGYYIIYAAGIQEPENPQLDQVKEQAATDYIAAKASEKAKEIADAVLKQLTDGEEFEAVAQSNNLTVENSGLLSRTAENSSDFPAALTGQVFNLSKSEPLPAEPASVGEDFYVFAFNKRVAPAKGTDEQLEQYRQALLRSKQQELLAAYIRNLEKDAEIIIHKSL